MRILTILALFISINLFGQDTIESLKIHWPEEYEWKIGSNEEDGNIHFLELIPGNETVENWTIIGTMMSLKDVRNVPMDIVINMMFEQSKIDAPESKLTLIEKNETDANHWALFTIESPWFNDDENPESQLFYIVQGNSSLYTNFVAIKEKELSKEFVDKWVKVFKASELVNR